MSMYTSGMESEIYQISGHLKPLAVVVIVSLHSVLVCVISVVLAFHRNKDNIYSHFLYSQQR